MIRGLRAFRLNIRVHTYISQQRLHTLRRSWLVSVPKTHTRAVSYSNVWHYPKTETSGNAANKVANAVNDVDNPVDVPPAEDSAQPTETSATAQSDSDPLESIELTPSVLQLETLSVDIKDTSDASSSSENDNTPDEAATEDEELTEDDFLTTIFGKMEPYLDTYSIYTALTRSGFTADQADELINLLVVQLNSKLSKLSTKYSQIYELENERYLFESAQQELRVDITRSREQHINELIALINILERDFSMISDDLNNHSLQMKNDTQVALNDQKSDNTLQSKKIILRIQETNHKITTELNSAMRSEIESLRWHLSRWGLMAIMLALFSACTAFYINKIKWEKRQNASNEFVPLVIYEPSEYDEDDYHTDLDRSVIDT